MYKSIDLLKIENKKKQLKIRELESLAHDYISWFDLFEDKIAGTEAHLFAKILKSRAKRILEENDGS